MDPFFNFKIISKDPLTNARVGLLKTPHGHIETPCFIPVGTKGAVKALSQKDLSAIGAQIVLFNTYHLSLLPGADAVKELGGIGTFTSWRGPTMTDSGGYQVFSLGRAKALDTKQDLHKFVLKSFPADTLLEKSRLERKRNNRSIKRAIIDEEGVTFYSYLNGEKRRFTPYDSVKIQEKIGADLVVAFDDHESPLWDYQEAKESLLRTNRWALESLKAKTRNDQMMYGVTHGGVYEDLRVSSAKFIDKHFQAVAIGGSYTSTKDLLRIIEWSTSYFTPEKPRHLLGIGAIRDLFEAVSRGMDFFDCVAPTRLARHGSIYVSPQSGGHPSNNFSLQITNAQYSLDSSPLDTKCLCYACQTYSRAYLRHLFRAKELLAFYLATYHNLFFICSLMAKIREAILAKNFLKLKNEWFL